MKIKAEFLNKGGTKNGWGYSWKNQQIELKKEWDALFISILQNESKAYLIDVMRDLWSMIDKGDK